MAMTLCFILSTAEMKYFHVQFRAIVSTYTDCVCLGLYAIVESMMTNPKAKVFWDHNIEALDKVAERTASFLDLPGVATMIGRIKINTKTCTDHDL